MSKQRSKTSVVITVDQYGKVNQNARFNPAAAATAATVAAAATFETHKLANK